MPIGKQKPLAKLLVTEGDAVQLSVAIGAVQAATAQVVVVVKLMLAGQADKTGACVSVEQGLLDTVTEKLQVAELLLASVAV